MNRFVEVYGVSIDLEHFQSAEILRVRNFLGPITYGLFVDLHGRRLQIGRSRYYDDLEERLHMLQKRANAYNAWKLSQGGTK